MSVAVKLNDKVSITTYNDINPINGNSLITTLSLLYSPLYSPPRRSLGAELSSQIPMFESGKSYQTNKLIDAAPDDDDEDIEDAEKSKTTQDTERKSGDGESASTTQEQGKTFTLCQLSEFKCTIIKSLFLMSLS